MKVALLAATVCSIVSTVMSTSATAAVLAANPANILSVFASAKAGDTIKASGTFGSVSLQNRAFTTRVTLDATNAVFTDTLTIQNVTGLNVLRGTFGSRTAAMRSTRTVIVTKSADIKFQTNTFIGNGLIAGADASHGLMVRNSTNVQVSAGNFSNFMTGLGVLSSTRVKVDSSKFTAMTSDGINIANSHFVTATANSCAGTMAYAGAHPDCIQLWSLLGQPVQSDIALIRNVANGATQGFASFNPSAGGGLRISMIGNIVATSFPQGLACYECVDSVFRDNILTTLPGARWQTRMNIIGGANNLIANNSIGLMAAPLTSVASQAARSVSMSAGLANDVSAIPEPSEWFMLTIGFGLVGGFSRRSKLTLQRRSA